MFRQFTIKPVRKDIAYLMAYSSVTYTCSLFHTLTTRCMYHIFGRHARQYERSEKVIVFTLASAPAFAVLVKIF